MPPSGHLCNIFICFSGERPIVEKVSLTAVVKQHHSEPYVYIHSDDSFTLNIVPDIMAIRNHAVMISDTT